MLEKGIFIKKIDKYNHYGTLITVVSFLFIIIFSNGNYDIWDELISIIVTIFGINYIHEKIYFDKKSLMLGFLILWTGVFVSLFGVCSFIFKKIIFYENYLLIPIILLTIIFSYLYQKKLNN